MKLLIVGLVVLALSVAGVSTYLIKSFSGEENIEGLQKEAQTKAKVLVAARSIRPGEAVTPGSLAWQAWSKDSLNEKFIVAENDQQAEKRIKDFHGGIARDAIQQGEPVLATKIFKSDKPGVLAGMLKGGMRAVSFQVSPQTAVAGFILPGDKVDILLTHKIKWEKKKKKEKEKEKKKRGGGRQQVEEATQTHMTETIMRNVTVLAINQAVDLAEGNSMQATTATLELTPKQAELLITARAVGKLSLVLRSLHTPEGASEKLTTTLDIEVSPFFSRLNALRRAAVVAKPPPQAAPPPTKKPPTVKPPTVKPPTKKPPTKKKTTIKIYRGTKAGGGG